MCGISLIHSDSPDLINPNLIDRMNAALRHRGPDTQKSIIHGATALGHTRLSIVDLRAGTQPMLSQDNRYAIVFNGEIYNFKEIRETLENQGMVFKTQTDTEVLLQAYQTYGSGCLAKLRGMFAFVIHDRQSDCLFAARDRMGIKPFFYHWNGSSLLAASEIKAILVTNVVEAKLNRQSIRNFFTYQFSVSPNTPFEDIYELPPGHQLTFSKQSGLKIESYWNIEFPADGDYESQDQKYWTSAFESHLQDAVASHMIGDVPIGSYLSGGIDSASLTWMLTRTYKHPLKTFSIHFSNSNNDESPIIKSIAKHLNVENSEVVLHDHKTTFLHELEQCIYYLEQPQRMALDIPFLQLSALVNHQHYKVVYCGDGADEIMGGYDCYRQDYMRYWGNQLKNYRLRRRHYLTEYTKYFSEPYIRLILELHRPKKQRQTIRKFGCYPAWFDFWHIMHSRLPGLFSEEFAIQTEHDTQLESLVEQMKPHLQGRHLLNQSLFMELKTRLPGWILFKSDRLSMANSVEARVPFLDHKLVELCARMPPTWKLNGMNEKFVLKQVAQPNLPEHPNQFKKRAFYSPIREWFFSPDRLPELQKYIGKEALLKTNMFNPNTVNAMLQEITEFPQTQDYNSYFRCMQLEWILMLVLTVQILHDQFVEKNAPCFDH